MKGIIQSRRSGSLVNVTVDNRQWIRVYLNVGVLPWTRLTMPNSLGIMFGTSYCWITLIVTELLSLPGLDCNLRVFREVWPFSYTDAYDIFAVNFANIMVGYVYTRIRYLACVIGHCNQDLYRQRDSCWATWLWISGRSLGRKKVPRVLIFVDGRCMVSNWLSLFSPLSPFQFLAKVRPSSVIGVMIFWRVILGTGIGGDYPLSSIITSEFATVKWRGAMMAAVFANQGWGQFTCALVTFITTIGFKNSLQTKYVWSQLQSCAWQVLENYLRLWRCPCLCRLVLPFNHSWNHPLHPGRQP